MGEIDVMGLFIAVVAMFLGMTLGLVRIAFMRTRYLQWKVEDQVHKLDHLIKALQERGI